MPERPLECEPGRREGEAFMNLVERVKAILLTPKTEWAAIEGEPGDPQFLFTNYVAILAAIPAVCGFIGVSIFGHSVAAGLELAVISYILAFVGAYVMALINDGLAPTFGGQKSQPSSLKLAVYSLTPFWLVGVFLLIPALGVLRILGLYGLYLFWIGAPMLMKVPEDKSIAYTAAVVVCSLVVWIVLGLLVTLIVGAGAVGWM